MTKTENSTLLYLELAASLLLEGEYEDSEEIYRTIIKTKPNHYWANCNLGRSLLYQGKVEEAILYLQNAIKLEPKVAEAYDYFGDAFIKQNLFEQAINAYNKAIELESNKFIYYHKLADVFLLEEKYEQAINFYKKALELNNEYAWSHCNMARALSQLGEDEKAIAAYQKAIALDPQQPDWVHQSLEQLLQKLEQSPQLAPDIIPEQDYFNLGNQHAEAGELDQAIDCYRKAIALHPARAHYHQKLADTLMQMGQFEEAADPYEKSLELNPDNPWACRGLGNSLQAQSQFQEATSLYRRAIELYPEDHDTYELLGNTLAKQGKFAEAIEAYGGGLEQNPQESKFQQRIEALKPKAAPDYFRLGEERASAEDWESAIAYYGEAINLKFQGEQVYHRLGNALFQQGKLEPALVAYQTALELKPDCLHSNKGLGHVLEQQGKHPEAIIAYRRALEVQPVPAKVGQKSKETAVPMDVVVTYNEVNNKHGTGILILRLFKNSSNIFSLRSRNDYEGEQDFGEIAVQFECSGLSRAEIYQQVIEGMEGIIARKVICIPYSPYDLLLAMAVKDVFNAKLCTYIMDDQNVQKHNIPDKLMEEALAKSSLRLAISPEIRDAYEQKYNLEFWLLPGLVPEELLQEQVTESTEYDPYTRTRRGILVGNIWAQRWLDSLCSTIQNLDLNIDWYANPNPGGLKFNKEKLHRDGLIQKGLVPEPKLVEILRKYPYSILPSGSSHHRDDRPEISKLSLPSRIPFIWATSNTPIIVLGSKDTAAARFVERFKAGVICDYNPQDFLQAVEYVCSPENQLTLRQNAAKVAQALSVQGIAQWIWNSLERGEPEDLRFERLLPRTGGVNMVTMVTNKNQPIDIIVNHNEINEQHGTGILLRRLFPDSSRIFAIRTHNHYGGQQEFGAVAMHWDCSGLSRSEVFRKISRDMEGVNAQKLLCVPYFSEDVLLSLAIKEIFGIPLCTYIMDDQNIHETGIPDQLMEELLQKSNLRLAISPELGQAYEDKYQLKFWILPAVAPQEYLQTQIQVPVSSNQFYASKTGVLIGNIWAQRWLDSLRQTLKATGIKIDWYGAANPTNLSFNPEELKGDGLIKQGFIPEKKLIDLLRQYPYALITTGSTEELEDRPEMAKLSLPSRVTYITAVANTPFIVLGSKTTAVARFVERFDLGVVCDYTASSFSQALKYICHTKIQQKMRQNASKLAINLSSAGMDQWIWNSLEDGKPWDLRFEELISS